MAEVFDAMVAAQPSNRAAYMAFVAVKSASARYELLEAAFDRAIPASDPARAEVSALIEAFGKFGARRNEIAHGIVFDLDEYGHFLAPNNIMRHKWTKDGEAKYQYTSEDIAYYVEQFGLLRSKADQIRVALIQRDIAARKIKETSSARNEGGKET